MSALDRCRLVPTSRQSPTASGWRSAIRAATARHPIAAFLVLVFSIAWPVLAVPVLAYHGVIPGGRMPPEAFALGITLFVMLPAALWVTAVTNGRDGVKALLHRALRWRFGWRWWAFVLFALPVTGLLIGLALGGSLRSTHALSVVGSSFASIGVAIVVINLWEETVWAGFLQTRLEQRHNLVTAAALTAFPFAGVHLPLLLMAHHITTASLLLGIGGLLVLAVVIRLMIGLLLRAAADSLLAAGVLHQVFDATNNKGGLVDRLLNGANEGVAALAAVGILTAVIAFCVRSRLGKAQASATSWAVGLRCGVGQRRTRRSSGSRPMRSISR